MLGMHTLWLTYVLEIDQAQAESSAEHPGPLGLGNGLVENGRLGAKIMLQQGVDSPLDEERVVESLRSQVVLDGPDHPVDVLCRAVVVVATDRDRVGGHDGRRPDQLHAPPQDVGKLHLILGGRRPQLPVCDRHQHPVPLGQDVGAQVVCQDLDQG